MASPFSPICSRLPWLLLLLTATTGLVDAGSVLGLGNVFTANMTGNVVFLGFAVTGRPGFHWQSYLAAIVAFMLGALIAGRLARGHGAGSLNRWLIRAALMESCLLWLAALAALMNAALAQRGDWLRGGFRDRDALAAFSVKSIVEQYRAVYRNEPRNGAKRAASSPVSGIPEAAG